MSATATRAVHASLPLGQSQFAEAKSIEGLLHLHGIVIVTQSPILVTPLAVNGVVDWKSGHCQSLTNRGHQETAFFAMLVH